MTACAIFEYEGKYRQQQPGTDQIPTMFGLVDQNYELPDEVLESVGFEVFKYEEFQFEKFAHEEFKFEEFSIEEFKTESISIGVLRRGVIGVQQIGYV